MIKIYFTYGFNKTREYYLIKQGLENNSRVELVDNEEESDFVFQFAYHHKRGYPKREPFPPGKTVVIDYHDNQRWLFIENRDKKKGWTNKVFKEKYNALAYFKRSWVDANKRAIVWPSNFHPLTFAIMDEFIIDEDMERNLILSCSLRSEERNINRTRVLQFLGRMNIPGKAWIGRYNKGAMAGFNDENMRAYFNLLRRSQIVVTCNPDKWEGDHRTWEAFASGALVFVDKMTTPLAHPLIDGEHCIFYELSDCGFRILREKLLYYLNHADKTEHIAKAGYDFTMKYHRASNRIDEILDVIT